MNCWSSRKFPKFATLPWNSFEAFFILDTAWHHKPLLCQHSLLNSASRTYQINRPLVAAWELSVNDKKCRIFVHLSYSKEEELFNENSAYNQHSLPSLEWYVHHSIAPRTYFTRYDRACWWEVTWPWFSICYNFSIRRSRWYVLHISRLLSVRSIQCSLYATTFVHGNTMGCLFC